MSKPTLTVILRDDLPLIILDDVPTYRVVQITLTDEQTKALTLRSNGASGRTRIFEEVSRAIIEGLPREGEVQP